jgi:protein SCO1/2
MRAVLKKFAYATAAFLIGMSQFATPRALAGPFDATGEGGPVVDKDTLKDVTVIEHTGAKLPLDLTFTDESGKTVRLGEYFDGKKPVVLQLGYYGCPMLCGLISRGLLDSVKKVSLTAGTDYEMVFVSIDPKESPLVASQKKDAYVAEYAKDASSRKNASGWHFLTGKQENIARLAEADGFRYKWIEAAGQFAHPPSLTLCMPDGRISRYMYGVRFDPFTLRESLVEASNGKIGNPGDQIFLTCFRYDGTQGKYAFAAISIMRGGGVLIMIIVCAVLVRMFRRERKLRGEQDTQTH